MVELLDFGEAHVDLRFAGFDAAADHVGETVKGLRPEDDVDVRGAADDAFPFLTGDAPADGDQETGVFALEFTQAAEVREDLLLRLFANRARVDDDEVGSFGGVDAFGAELALQEVGESRRVVIVHLAAEAAEVEFLSKHGLGPVTGNVGGRAAPAGGARTARRE